MDQLAVEKRLACFLLSLFSLSLFAMVVAALERTSERKRLLMWSLDRAAYKGDIWRMVQVLMRVCNEHACPKLGESILISMPLFQLLETSSQFFLSFISLTLFLRLFFEGLPPHL